MDYQVYDPDPRLAEFIKCYWTLDGPEDPVHMGPERIFPDGSVEMIFHLRDPFRIYKGSGSQLQERFFLHGQLREYIELGAGGRVSVLGVRFHPSGLQAFVDFDVDQLTGGTVCLDECWKKDAGELQDRIMNALDHPKRITLLENFLLKKLAGRKVPDTIIRYCVNSVLRGEDNIERMASNVNLGRRQLERRFIASVGLSPKMFSRIIRFHNTLNLLERGNFNSLTMLALESGFYDQAHFIKDFREFTGLNPRQYFASNLPLVRFFNLD